MLVLRIHEAKIKFGQLEPNHLVLVANITDDGPGSYEASRLIETSLV